MTSKRRRFLLAVTLSSLLWAVVLAHTTVTRMWTPGAYDNMIPLYPPPHEIILLTLLAAAVSMWLYTWAKRDRVRQVLSSLDAQERQVLLHHLLIENHTEAISSKRKRRLSDDSDLPEIEPVDDAETSTESAFNR
jgi:hypothetical protein